MGDGLRLLLASPNHLKERMKEQLGEKFASVEADLKRWLDELKEPIRLFREGGFATVDEFNRLAGPHFEMDPLRMQTETSNLRKHGYHHAN